MIQRKQSLWLLIAALLNVCVLLFGLYDYHILENGKDMLKHLRVADHYPSLIITVVMVMLPLVTIFLFNNRKRQMSMTAYAMVAEAAFVTALLVRVGSLAKLVPPPLDGSGNYGIGAILPIIAFVFLVMALVGIRKDEKLVKSVDRLR